MAYEDLAHRQQQARTRANAARADFDRWLRDSQTPARRSDAVPLYDTAEYDAALEEEREADAAVLNYRRPPS